MRLRKRHTTGVAAFLVAVLTLVYLWHSTPIVARQVSKRFTENLLQQHGYKLELDAVRGSVFGQLVFLGPKLLAAGDSSRVVARAQGLRLRLHPMDILRGRIIVDELAIVRPQVDLGALRRSAAAEAAKPAGGGREFPRLSIDKLSIVDGTIAEHGAPGRGLDVRELNAELAVSSAGRQVRVRLDRASARLPADSLRVEDAAGSFLWQSDSLLVETARLRTGGSLLEVQGRVVPGRSSGWLAVTATPLDLREVGRLAARPLGGSLQGPLEVRWQGKQVQLAGTVSGTVDRYRFDQVQADLSWVPPRLEVRRAAGRVNDSPLVLQLVADRGSLHGKLALEGVDLRRLLPDRAAELPDNEVSGEVGFARAAAADTLRLDVELRRSRLRGIEIERLSGHVARGGDLVRVRGGLVESPLGRAGFSGELRGEDLGLDFDLQADDVAGLLGTFGVRGVQGGVQAKGSLHGPLRDLGLEAEVSFDSLRYGGARSGPGEVTLASRHLGPQAEFDATVRVDSLRTGGHELRGISAELSYAGRTLRVLRSQASAGDTLLAAAGSVRALDHDWADRPRPSTLVQLETALVRLGNQEIRVEDPASIWVRKGATRIDSLRIVTRGGRLRFDADLDREARDVSGRLEVQEFDLGFMRELLRLRPSLAGTASGWIEARGTLDRTRLDGEIRAARGAWESLPFDSLEVVLHSDASALDVPKVHLVTPQGSLAGHLRLGYLPALGRWIEGERGVRAPAEIDSAQVSGNLQIAAADLGRIWAARPPAAGKPVPPPWTARLACDLGLSGSVGRPILDMRGQATELRWGASPTGVLRFAARYAGERLAVSEAELQEEGEVVRAQASIPMRIDLASGVQLQRDQPVEVHVVLPRSSFALAARSLPLFELPPPEVPAGEIEAQLDITGTLAAPEARGGLHVYGAAFLVRGMEELYRGVDIEGEFRGDTLRLTSMSGRSGDKGTLRGSGEAVFAPWRLRDFGIRLDVDQVPITSIPQVTGVVSGRLEIKGAPSKAGHTPVPDITGDMRVLEAQITQEFTTKAEQTDLIQPTEQPDWLADVNLAAPGNVWLHNSQADAELQGNIEVRRTAAGLDFKGLATIKRGDYSYYLERFKIQSGGTLDFSRYPGFDPELDIQGEARRPNGKHIYVTLNGPSTKPQASFSSDDPELLTSAQIQDELIRPTAGKAGESLPGVGAATKAFATGGERIINDLAQLQYFSIDPVLERQAGTPAIGYNVSAGKAMTDRLFLIYTQGLAASALHQNVQLEFDINSKLLLDASYERGAFRPGEPDQVQDAFDLLLKFRHEY